MKGDEQAFGEWYDAKEEKWQHFIAWFAKHSLQLSKDQCFHRTHY